MATINGKNCAFPLFDTNGAPAVNGEVNTLGLTKREYLASMFLTSMVSRPKFIGSIERRLNPVNYDLYSKQALALADSLLEMLEA